jgi:hypothetical protein
MNYIVDENAQGREKWNYFVLLLSLFGAVVLQGAVLAYLSYRGMVTHAADALDDLVISRIFFAVDVIVILRLLIARVCRECGKGWVFYAILPYLIIPAILLVVHLWVR